MPVPSSISELSQTPGSNFPAGGESVITADDYLRTYAAFIAQLYAGAIKDPAGVRATLAIANRGALWGCTLSNNVADATNDIDIAAGECVDSTGVVLMKTIAAQTKRLDAAWAAGSGNGGLDTGSIANTTYHVFRIIKDSDGSVDHIFSTTAAGPLMPSGYTYFRRIGSVVRVSGAITLFDQHGDDFTLRTSVNDYNQGTPGTGPITITLASLPTGIVVEANIIVSVGGQSGSINGARMSALTSTDEAPGQSNCQVYFSNVANGVQSGQVSGVFTNTAAQIRGRIVSSATGAQLVVRSQGWTDTRGRV